MRNNYHDIIKVLFDDLSRYHYYSNESARNNSLENSNKVVMNSITNRLNKTQLELLKDVING